MITTKISTIRLSVITLLRKSGKSPIEATDLWDRVYSRQIEQAPPGTHKFIIGEYTLEFTVPGQSKAETVISATDPDTGNFPLAFVALVVIVALVVLIWGIPLIF